MFPKPFCRLNIGVSTDRTLLRDSAADLVSYDLTVKRTRSVLSSFIRNCLTLRFVVRIFPDFSRSWTPLRLIVATVLRLWCISRTSWPDLSSRNPNRQPIAPAPTTAIRNSQFFRRRLNFCRSSSSILKTFCSCGNRPLRTSSLYLFKDPLISSPTLP